MPKINKVVATVWYDKAHMYDLRRVFPDAEFVYVDFFDKDRLTEEVKDADAAILFGDVDNCLLGENSLKWIHCDHAGLNGSARPEVFARDIPVTGAAGRSAPVLAEHCIYFMLQHCYHTKELLDAQEKKQFGIRDKEDKKGAKLSPGKEACGTCSGPGVGAGEGLGGAAESGRSLQRNAPAPLRAALEKVPDLP